MNGIEELEHADNICGDSAKGGGVVFGAVRCFFAQSHFDESLRVASDVDGLGVGCKCVLKTVLKSRCFCKHARVVVMLGISFAVDMSGSDMVMMGDE